MSDQGQNPNKFGKGNMEDAKELRALFGRPKSPRRNTRARGRGGRGTSRQTLGRGDARMEHTNTRQGADGPQVAGGHRGPSERAVEYSSAPALFAPRGPAYSKGVGPSQKSNVGPNQKSNVGPNQKSNVGPSQKNNVGPSQKSKDPSKRSLRDQAIDDNQLEIARQLGELGESLGKSLAQALQQSFIKASQATPEKSPSLQPVREQQDENDLIDLGEPASPRSTNLLDSHGEYIDKPVMQLTAKKEAGDAAMTGMEIGNRPGLGASRWNPENVKSPVVKTPEVESPEVESPEFYDGPPLTVEESSPVQAQPCREKGRIVQSGLSKGLGLADSRWAS
ncbi:hypothetical protein F4804DRAFT_332959 [Jackrogersella minutella]|nr:hypothetical protein F4804DRAFT_332959 [Jackrogersella minutella]